MRFFSIISKLTCRKGNTSTMPDSLKLKNRIDPEVTKSPNLKDQPTALLHTRRNLLFASFIIVFSTFFGLKINKSIFNGYIYGIEDFHINLAALFMIIYFLFSFLLKWFTYVDKKILEFTCLVEYQDVTYAGDDGGMVAFESRVEPSSLYNWWVMSQSCIRYKIKKFHL